MAKLQTPSKTGFNAGDGYNVKYIQIDKIIIDKEISGLFKPSEKITDEICQSIIKDGFHKEEPITLLEGSNTLLDGHQRYEGAKKAGLVEIPYIEKSFDCREDAILYSYQRQAVRRNLKYSEILAVAKMMMSKRSKSGEGRNAEIWAKLLGVSTTTMYQASSVVKNAPEEDLQAIINGEASIKKIYNKNNPSKKSVIDEDDEEKDDEVKFTVNDSQSLPPKVSFLKGAVILLVDKKQIAAAELLINHYLEKNEKRGFYNLLPETISKQLSRLPLLHRV